MKIQKTDPESPGELFHPDTRFLRSSAATAKDEKSGIEYECTTNFTSGTPLVRSSKTGRWFTLDWPAIIALAVKAGIDDESEPVEVLKEACSTT